MKLLVIDGSITLHRAKNRLISAAKDKYSSLIEKGHSDIVSQVGSRDVLKISDMMSIFFSILPAKIEEFRANSVYVLWDEGKCNYRCALNPDYKLARNAKPKTFIETEADELYKQARTYLHQNLPTIGIASILIPGVEADDIAYYLSHNFGNGVLMSDDKDWFLNLTSGWQLCRPMQKSNYLTSWSEFDSMMKGGNTSCKSSARNIYLHEKALVGDKDEIPRITTAAPAKRIAEFLVGLRDDLSSKDREILNVSLDNIRRNIKLADTSWLVTHPDIEDMSVIMTKVHSAIEIGNFSNFMQFASDTRSFAYSSRWNTISRGLAY